MKPQKHAKVIKAWAEGAEIEIYGVTTNERTLLQKPNWLEEGKYRIKPDCEYAYQKVFELGGDDAVVLYEQFLKDPKQVEGSMAEGNVWAVLGHHEDPFGYFVRVWYMADGKIRKKKQTVTEVLWVATIGDVLNSGEFRWCLDGVEPPKTGIHTFHKVPTCTREVEV